jgi:phasin family protein
MVVFLPPQSAPAPKRDLAMAKDTSAKDGALPSFDFSKLLGQYKMPGVDFSAIMEREKKNIEALTKANKVAYEGWQALLKKQAEIFQETMSETMAAAKKQDAVKQRADVAKQGFEKALDNMKQLAEMATKSQREAYEILRQRTAENMEELRNFGKK